MSVSCCASANARDVVPFEEGAGTVNLFRARRFSPLDVVRRSEIRTAITWQAYATASRNINPLNENGIFDKDSSPIADPHTESQK
jgi:hypothetical protein